MRFESIFNSTNNKTKNVREVNHIFLVLILKIYKTIIIKKNSKNNYYFSKCYTCLGIYIY
jgi:hypothetical protein